MPIPRMGSARILILVTMLVGILASAACGSGKDPITCGGESTDTACFKLDGSGKATRQQRKIESTRPGGAKVTLQAYGPTSLDGTVIAIACPPNASRNCGVKNIVRWLDLKPNGDGTAASGTISWDTIPVGTYWVMRIPPGKKEDRSNMQDTGGRLVVIDDQPN